MKDLAGRWSAAFPGCGSWAGAAAGADDDFGVDCVVSCEVEVRSDCESSHGEESRCMSYRV